MLRFSVLPALAACALLAGCAEKPEAAVEPVAPNAALVPTDSASKNVSANADMAAVLGAPQGSSVCRNYQRKLGALSAGQANGQRGAQSPEQIKAQIDALKAIIKDACS